MSTLKDVVEAAGKAAELFEGAYSGDNNKINKDSLPDTPSTPDNNPVLMRTDYPDTAPLPDWHPDAK